MFMEMLPKAKAALPPSLARSLSRSPRRPTESERASEATEKSFYKWVYVVASSTCNLSCLPCRLSSPPLPRRGARQTDGRTGSSIISLADDFSFNL